MTDFMIHFLISNVSISGIIGILLLSRRVFKNSLSSRMQYHLWFLLLGVLIIPFVPFYPNKFPDILSWIHSIRNSIVFYKEGTIKEGLENHLTGNTNWIHDFAISVDRRTPPVIGYLLFGIWLAGIFVMLLLWSRSFLRLRRLKKSALPLQNLKVSRLYHQCLEKAGLRRAIPIYSTAFLESPIIVGVLKPGIYLPIHLISEYQESDMGYMLLHELQHYKHHDAIICFLMNLIRVPYWFHPLVWHALQEMRHDRELACDSSVLEMLEEDAYEEYGNTLINFAEKISLNPFPFSTGLGGSKKQITRRIIHIAAYEKPTALKKFKGSILFLFIAVFLFGLTPFVSANTSDANHYQWNFPSRDVTYIDLSAYFGAYEGSFVLYDTEQNLWTIYNKDYASLRISPNSTYKIYDTLFALESGIITPENSLIPWNGDTYPFEAWNADQTLSSAMAASVNWYFQAIDKQLGASKLSRYIRKVGYGNQNINGSSMDYWLESSLEISAIEQVELLIKLQNNSFHFAPENINAVKESIHLSASDNGTLYGKTGTGRVNNQDIHGWFIGYIENIDHICFFATNIAADDDATGSNAAEITLSILSDRNLWS